MVLLDLPGQFLQHFPGQFHPIVVMLRELNESHQISLGFIALEVGHQAIVIIEFFHGFPALFAVANANNDHTQG